MSDRLDDLRAQLEAHLAAQLGESAHVEGLRRLAGGSAHETWSFDLRLASAPPRGLVMRRDIEGSMTDSDGQLEFELLSVLHDLGLPVVRQWTRAAGPPAFTVMERIGGVDVRKVLARPPGDLDRDALAQRLVDIQVAIHAVDWRTQLAGILDAPADGDCASAEVERWARTLADNELEREPLLCAAIDWLRAHPPPPTEPVLVHGDFKTNNLLRDAGTAGEAGGRGTVVALDWELAHIGDPVEDLAWTRLWTTGFDLVGGLYSAPGYVAAYAASSGRTVDEHALFFWELHALVKLAAILQTGVRTLPVAPLQALMGRAQPFLERRIADRLLDALEREAA